MSDQAIDRTELPIRRPPFQGVVQRTLDGSQPDWNYVAPLSPPEGAPNKKRSRSKASCWYKRTPTARCTS